MSASTPLLLDKNGTCRNQGGESASYVYEEMGGWLILLCLMLALAPGLCLHPQRREATSLSTNPEPLSVCRGSDVTVRVSDIYSSKTAEQDSASTTESPLPAAFTVRCYKYRIGNLSLLVHFRVTNSNDTEFRFIDSSKVKVSERSPRTVTFVSVQSQDAGDYLYWQAPVFRSTAIHITSYVSNSVMILKCRMVTSPVFLGNPPILLVLRAPDNVIVTTSSPPALLVALPDGYIAGDYSCAAEGIAMSCLPEEAASSMSASKRVDSILPKPVIDHPPYLVGRKKARVNCTIMLNQFFAIELASKHPLEWAINGRSEVIDAGDVKQWRLIPETRQDVLYYVSQLDLGRVGVADIGNTVTCTANVEEQTSRATWVIRVVFPPYIPTITGPDSVLPGSHVRFTCIVDGATLVPPIVTWTDSTNRDLSNMVESSSSVYRKKDGRTGTPFRDDKESASLVSKQFSFTVGDSQKTEGGTQTKLKGNSTQLEPGLTPVNDASVSKSRKKRSDNSDSDTSLGHSGRSWGSSNTHSVPVSERVAIGNISTAVSVTNETSAGVDTTAGKTATTNKAPFLAADVPTKQGSTGQTSGDRHEQLTRGTDLRPSEVQTERDNTFQQAVQKRKQQKHSTDRHSAYVVKRQVNSNPNTGESSLRETSTPAAESSPDHWGSAGVDDKADNGGDDSGEAKDGVEFYRVTSLLFYCPPDERQAVELQCRAQHPVLDSGIVTATKIVLIADHPTDPVITGPREVLPGKVSVWSCYTRGPSISPPRLRWTDSAGHDLTVGSTTSRTVSVGLDGSTWYTLNSTLRFGVPTHAGKFTLRCTAIYSVVDVSVEGVLDVDIKGKNFLLPFKNEKIKDNNTTKNETGPSSLPGPAPSTKSGPSSLSESDSPGSRGSSSSGSKWSGPPQGPDQSGSQGPGPSDSQGPGPLGLTESTPSGSRGSGPPNLPKSAPPGSSVSGLSNPPGSDQTGLSDTVPLGSSVAGPSSSPGSDPSGSQGSSSPGLPGSTFPSSPGSHLSGPEPSGLPEPVSPGKQGYNPPGSQGSSQSQGPASSSATESAPSGSGGPAASSAAGTNQTDSSGSRTVSTSESKSSDSPGSNTQGSAPSGSEGFVQSNSPGSGLPQSTKSGPSDTTHAGQDAGLPDSRESGSSNSSGPGPLSSKSGLSDLRSSAPLQSSPTNQTGPDTSGSEGIGSPQSGQSISSGRAPTVGDSGSTISPHSGQPRTPRPSSTNSPVFGPSDTLNSDPSDPQDPDTSGSSGINGSASVSPSRSPALNQSGSPRSDTLDSQKSHPSGSPGSVGADTADAGPPRSGSAESSRFGSTGSTGSTSPQTPGTGSSRSSSPSSTAGIDLLGPQRFEPAGPLTSSPPGSDSRKNKTGSTGEQNGPIHTFASSSRKRGQGRSFIRGGSGSTSTNQAGSDTFDSARTDSPDSGRSGWAETVSTQRRLTDSPRSGQSSTPTPSSTEPQVFDPSSTMEPGLPDSQGSRTFGSSDSDRPGSGRSTLGPSPYPTESDIFGSAGTSSRGSDLSGLPETSSSQSGSNDSPSSGQSSTPIASSAGSPGFGSPSTLESGPSEPKGTGTSGSSDNNGQPKLPAFGPSSSPTTDPFSPKDSVWSVRSSTADTDPQGSGASISTTPPNTPGTSSSVLTNPLAPPGFDVLGSRWSGRLAPFSDSGSRAVNFTPSSRKRGRSRSFIRDNSTLRGPSLDPSHKLLDPDINQTISDLNTTQPPDPLVNTRTTAPGSKKGTASVHITQTPSLIWIAYGFLGTLIALLGAALVFWVHRLFFRKPEERRRIPDRY
ncbi:hypothetical protein BaRGS_00036241 [Batillaria attramentaria]|uniref:Ig-like domain-containing protein n=1 Tax=Batillaria attramentaria TaxID=370345 RepID=A0ABD0JCC1_9CAEN